MRFKSFRVQCILRIGALCVTMFLLLWLYFQTGLYASMVLLAGVLVFQVYNLIRYVDRTNRDLSRFMDAIQYEDFSQSFAPGALGSSFADLKQSMVKVIQLFQAARAEKEEHFQYLQTIVEHIGTGLLCYRQDGAVELMNTAARRLLKTGAVRHIQALKGISCELAAILEQPQPGARRLLKVIRNDEELHLSLNAAEFRMRGTLYRLVSLQDIHAELEEKELEAWQTLVRVLTHEMMNSITPISSLAATAGRLLDEHCAQTGNGQVGLQHEDLQDVHEAVTTIRKRSEGLLKFVDTYRKLSHIPKPEFRLLPVSELFARVSRLLEAELSGNGITLECRIEPDKLELVADPELVEQVLINLLMNAVQALRGQAEPRIGLSAGVDAMSRVVISVRDNGPGIMKEVQEKIFIPFFTTRRDGSGIGLSLARQIMRLHKGTIRVQSVPGKETIFTLKF